MAFVYRDTNLPSRAKWGSMSTVYQRFKKAWPNNGSVYEKKMKFYQGDSYIEDISMKRFFNSVGISWEEMKKQKVDNEIEAIYFKLEDSYCWDGTYEDGTDTVSTCESTQLVAPSRQEIMDMFNSTFREGQIITPTVVYGGSSKKYVNDYTLPWHINEAGVIEGGGVNTPAVREAIESDPWYYLANARISDYELDNPSFQEYEGGNYDMPTHTNNPTNRLVGSCQTKVTQQRWEEPPCRDPEDEPEEVEEGEEPLPECEEYIPVYEDPMYALGAFALMQEGGSFRRVEGSLTENFATVSTSRFDGESLEYSFSYDYEYIPMKIDDGLIDSIIAFYQNKNNYTMKLNKKLDLKPRGEYRDVMMGHTRDNLFKKVLNEMTRYLDIETGKTYDGVTNSLFLNGKLRVYQASMMKRSDFVVMVASSMDTDYDVEEAEWWEKVVAVIIAIIAIIVFVYSLGTLAAVTPLILAQAAGMTSLVLTIGALGLSMFGGLSAGGLVEIIGAVAQIVGYIALVAGVFAAINSAGQSAAKQALLDAGKEVSTEAIKTEMLTRSLLDNVGALMDQTLNTATSKVTEFMTMSGTEMFSTVTDGISYITKGLELYNDKEAQELNKDVAELEEEQKEIERETLSNQLKSPAEVWLVGEDRVTSYDAIANMDLTMQNLVNGTDSFNTWNSNVNAT